MQAVSEGLIPTNCPACASEDYRPERIVKGYTLVKCQCCGFVFANPQLSADAVKAFYQEQARFARNRRVLLGTDDSPSPSGL
jgi:ribosomal protein L37AE/L43A